MRDKIQQIREKALAEIDKADGLEKWRKREKTEGDQKYSKKLAKNG